MIHRAMDGDEMTERLQVDPPMGIPQWVPIRQLSEDHVLVVAWSQGGTVGGRETPRSFTPHIPPSHPSQSLRIECIVFCLCKDVLYMALFCVCQVCSIHLHTQIYRSLGNPKPVYLRTDNSLCPPTWSGRPGGFEPTNPAHNVTGTIVGRLSQPSQEGSWVKLVSSKE